MYKVNVNGDQVVEIVPGDNGATVNNQQVDFDCKRLPDGNYHILINNKSLIASGIEVDRNAKKVTLLLDGKKFEVEVEDDFDLLLARMGMDRSAAQKVSEVKSPMPGLVLSIKVEVGASVEKDQPLMVLEAMKMENVIAAPGEGVVKSIEVGEQDKVDKNQVLIRFE